MQDVLPLPRPFLRTKILACRGSDSSRMFNSKGWNSQAHRKFPGKFESSKLSRDYPSREIGRTSSGATLETTPATRGGAGDYVSRDELCCFDID